VEQIPLGQLPSNKSYGLMELARGTTPQVGKNPEDEVFSWPHLVFREILLFLLVTAVVLFLAIFWNAPLEEYANAIHPPNPAKAPWYFLGLQELLHYFPPVVAGVLVPTLLIISLVIIPYFNVNIEANGLFLKDRTKRLRLFYLSSLGMLIFLLLFHVYVAVPPTVLVALAMIVAANSTPDSPSRLRRYLARRPLAYWIMTWFLFELIVLTAVGTWFRGPGWSWVLPWRS